MNTFEYEYDDCLAQFMKVMQVDTAKPESKCRRVGMAMSKTNKFTI